MASSTTVPKAPLLSVRGSEGLYLLTPSESNYSQLSKLDGFQDNFKNCRISAFDNSGRYFSYCNSTSVFVVDLKNECKVVATINRPRTSYIKFSPQGSFLVLWETFYVGKDGNADNFNLNIYETVTGKLIKSFVQKKQAENFVDWTGDDSVFAVLIGPEVLFYDPRKMENPPNRIKIENLSSFSMHPTSKYVAVYGAGKKSQPSFIRLYQYPKVDTVVANKSFFGADKVEFKWSCQGTNLLLLCSTETSQNSYYGDSTLHQIGVNGESQLVQLSKKGPIYAVEWNPVREEFIVIYGTMPAKASLYNGKCEVVYEFGTGPRNECHFNPHGNIVCLAGFGNLAGRIEVWSLAANNKIPQEINTFQVDDVTSFQWSPDGEHILTATTAPRLRVSNGFKVWNYLGENKYIYKVPANNELWQVQWQPGTYPIRPVIKKPAVVVKEETKAYVPPHLRGTNKVSTIKNKLHDDDEKPDNKLRVKSDVIDNEKKIKTLKKKLTQIEDLRKRQAGGEKLEKNQLEKLSTVDEILEEIKKLELGQ